MAGRLNHLFQNSPLSFLKHTVLFVDGLSHPEAFSRMRHKTTHLFDLEPVERRARMRVLPAMHLYQDAPLIGYYLPQGGTISIPRENSAYPLVVLPEFTRCRLLVSENGPDWLRLDLEENLNGRVPAAGKPSIDSFAYWDYTHGHLVGVVRATAVLVKPFNQPWTVMMQQIVGPAGHELVRQTFTYALTA